jgi:hypothetical protein
MTSKSLVYYKKDNFSIILYKSPNLNILSSCEAMPDIDKEDLKDIPIIYLPGPVYLCSFPLLYINELSILDNIIFDRLLTSIKKFKFIIRGLFLQGEGSCLLLN